MMHWAERLLKKNPYVHFCVCLHAQVAQVHPARALLFSKGAFLWEGFEGLSSTRRLNLLECVRVRETSPLRYLSVLVGHIGPEGYALSLALNGRHAFAHSCGFICILKCEETGGSEAGRTQYNKFPVAAKAALHCRCHSFPVVFQFSISERCTCSRYPLYQASQLYAFCSLMLKWIAEPAFSGYWTSCPEQAVATAKHPRVVEAVGCVVPR